VLLASAIFGSANNFSENKAHSEIEKEIWFSIVLIWFQYEEIGNDLKSKTMQKCWNTIEKILDIPKIPKEGNIRKFGTDFSRVCGCIWQDL
jgi:hypothetical protein